MSVTLQEAMKLSGIEDWTLTPSQQKYLIVSTEGLLARHPPEWFKEHQSRFKVELEQVFNEI
jgi:hypothetical protein